MLTLTDAGLAMRSAAKKCWPGLENATTTTSARIATHVPPVRNALGVMLTVRFLVDDDYAAATMENAAHRSQRRRQLAVSFTRLGEGLRARSRPPRSAAARSATLSGTADSPR